LLIADEIEHIFKVARLKPLVVLIAGTFGGFLL
jgi:hypothetical protein